MSAWPWPGDSPLKIARKVAAVYREHLRTTNRTLCDTVDDAMVDVGQLWIVPQVEGDPTDTVTTAEAAALASVSRDTIRRWACTPHPRPEYPHHMLLPRFGRRGREVTYLRTHVEAARHIAATERVYRRAA